ncbi:MAG: cyclic-di-AMP receptor [Limnochordales bacterium]|nr:cyclic-di-AMP receptor [Limnochordales bacterium]
MKLMLAVLEDDDVPALMEALAAARIGATKLASTGGFLLQGNTTLLIGVEDTRAEEVLQIIRRVAVRRRMVLPTAASEGVSHLNLPIEVEIGGAIVFTLDVESFYRI